MKTVTDEHIRNLIADLCSFNPTPKGASFIYLCIGLSLSSILISIYPWGEIRTSSHHLATHARLHATTPVLAHARAMALPEKVVPEQWKVDKDLRTVKGSRVGIQIILSVFMS